MPKKKTAKRAPATKKETKPPSAGRALWSGAIAFGLINIPIKLFKATSERNIDLDLLHRADLGRIHYVRVCQEDGKEIPWDEIVKGYEYEEGDYVVLEDEDFERASPKKTQAIEISQFAAEDEIDSEYFQTPYFMVPEKNAARAYVLLLEALKRSKKVAVARFVMRTKEHLAILKAKDDLLILQEIRFPSEMRDPSGLKIPEAEKTSAKELDLALSLIDQLTEPFDPEQFKDTFVDELKEIIEEKAKGERPRPAPKKVRATQEDDLLESLRASLERSKTPTNGRKEKVPG